MGRGLATLGAMLLLTTLALWIGDAVSALPSWIDAGWSSWTLQAGAVLLGGGLLLRLLTPVTHQLVRGRCAVCGHPVERGHTYCLDHLQETLNTYRDRTHDELLRGGKSHSSSS